MPAPISGLSLGMALMLGACNPEQPTSSPGDVATVTGERLALRAFVKGLETARYQVEIDEGDPGRGATEPLVTLVVFTDDEDSDPEVKAELERLLAAHPDELRVVVITNLDQAKRLGITWRPTFFANGVSLVGDAAVAGLAGVVATELETARELVARGAARGDVYGLLMSRAARERTEPPLLRTYPIPWEGEFAAEPIAREEREGGLVVEDISLGEGAEVVEGKMISFEFKGYATGTGKQVMGSRTGPAKMILDDSNYESDPLAAAMSTSLLGMRVGGKRRIKIPAAIVDRGLPEGRAPMGALWLGVEIVDVLDAPDLAPATAFAGKPIRSETRDDGLEIHDYRRGKGPAAKEGMTVEVHYIGQLADGAEFDSSHARPDGMKIALPASDAIIDGFAAGIEGARVGMLRKIVIPPELGYGDQQQGKIPPDTTLVFLLQVMSVTPTEENAEP